MHNTGDGGRRNGLGLRADFSARCTKAVPTTVPESKLLQRGEGQHLWEGLRSMKQTLRSLEPACFRVQGFLTENNQSEGPS